jgi:hypothetical protein
MDLNSAEWDEVLLHVGIDIDVSLGVGDLTLQILRRVEDVRGAVRWMS